MDDKCIICGEAAEFDVGEGYYKMPVCAKHLRPRRDIEAYLALENFKRALIDELIMPIVRLIKRGRVE